MKNNNNGGKPELENLSQGARLKIESMKMKS